MSPEENDIMRSVEDHYWWYQALRSHVAAAIEPAAPNFSLLDAGCGTGGMLKVLREKFPAADLTGVDRSSHAVELTAARETGAKLSVASVEELPFPENSFDFVISLDVLTAIGLDDSLAVHEFHRVLRPGGRLILNLAALEFLKGAHDARWMRTAVTPGRQLRALLEGAHFRRGKIELLERHPHSAHRPRRGGSAAPVRARTNAALGFQAASRRSEFDS